MPKIPWVEIYKFKIKSFRPFVVVFYKEWTEDGENRIEIEKGIEYLTAEEVGQLMGGN